MAVADRLVPMVIEVTLVNERIKRLRITRTLGVVSLVPVYALFPKVISTVNRDSVSELMAGQANVILWGRCVSATENTHCILDAEVGVFAG